MGQGRAGGGVEFVGLGIALGKDQAADGQHRRGSIQRKAPLSRRRLWQGQCTALGQRPQGQRFAGLPCVGVGRRQRVFAPQAVDVQESQEALQFLACVLVVGQATAQSAAAAAQFQHRRAGQQVEHPPAGRVRTEQCQMGAQHALKIRLAGNAPAVLGLLLRCGNGLDHGWSFSIPFLIRKGTKRILMEKA